MTRLTRSQVLENRMIWIRFMQNKKIRKAQGMLDNGKGGRCCLGHGCYALKVHRVQKDGEVFYGKRSDLGLAPTELVDLVGLWDNDGSPDFGGLTVGEDQYLSLTDVNDDTELRPWEIAAYLLEVVEGGEGTPFKPLTEYPEV